MISDPLEMSSDIRQFALDHRCPNLLKEMASVAGVSSNCDQLNCLTSRSRHCCYCYCWCYFRYFHRFLDFHSHFVVVHFRLRNKEKFS